MRSPHIVTGFVIKLHISGIIRDEGYVVVWHLENALIGIAHPRFQFRACLGSDQNDTVGRPRSVDCGGCGIFQDRYGFDIVRVHIVHVPFDTIHKDQRRACIRIVVDSERTYTTDTDTGLLRTGLAGSLHDRHSRSHSGKGGGSVHYRTALRQFAEINRCHGAGDVRLALCAVADHHDLLQQFGILAHSDIDDITCAHRHRHGPIAEAGEYKGRILHIPDFQMPVAIQVRLRALQRALHHDCDSY